MANQTWLSQEFAAPDGEQAAVNFLNEPLRQGRGEASATFPGDGTAKLLWLEPGSLGDSTAQTWQLRDDPAPDGEQAAVNFLNEPARQGAGEASVTFPGDGSSRLLWLEPGSLGDSTAQTWELQEFPAPDGEQAAVNFLNEPARQGAGEASVTPRPSGSAGLLWLAPGSLGDSTAQTWNFKDFPGPDGEQSALAFLNATPRQGPGEATGYVREDGSAAIFYLEPGSG